MSTRVGGRYIRWGTRVLEAEKILTVTKSKRLFYWSRPHRVTVEYAQPSITSETTRFVTHYETEIHADKDVVWLKQQA